jgi:hypothetical protein
MKKKKQNDCVELKNKIQEKLYKKYRNLTDEERQALINQKLETSDSPIAVFWRQNVLRVADKKSAYKTRGKEGR